jgi:thioredoxin-like negative regulator of GroEL
MYSSILDALDWHNPLYLLFGLFALWMLVDAIRRQEWLWALFIFLFPPLNAVLYYFLVYRQAAPAVRGFELPGAHDRHRIRELQDRIHHLDKAHHHAQLGDLYFQQGKLAKAEECYRAALEREPNERDTLAHYGQCLLRQNRTTEALPLLERVCAQEAEHDYGHSLMALAETYGALGQTPEAVKAWRQVLASHSYARARVQLAKLYVATGQSAQALAEVKEVLADDPHLPAFQRKREAVWVREARALERRLRAAG